MDKTTCSPLPQGHGHAIPPWEDARCTAHLDFQGEMQWDILPGTCTDTEEIAFQEFVQADMSFDAGEFSSGFDYRRPCRVNFSLVG